MALVVFLRGMNVGGHRSFRPTALARQLQHLDAINIGAAGTFVIGKRIGRRQLRTEITSRIPFDAEIIICEGREIAGLLSHDYFVGYQARDNVVRFVSILSRRPEATSLPFSLPTRGSWLLRVLGRSGRFVFGVYRRDMKVIRYLGKLDEIFGVRATTRNWNTLTTITKVLNARTTG